MAVSITALELAAAANLPTTGLGDTLASAVGTRLLAVVAARIQRYAPSAPEAVQNEAAIRFSAYLNAAVPTPNLAQGSLGIGDISTSSQGAHSHAGSFRVSGAKALLSSWRIRRGTVADA